MAPSLLNEIHGRPQATRVSELSNEAESLRQQLAHAQNASAAADQARVEAEALRQQLAQAQNASAAADQARAEAEALRQQLASSPGAVLVSELRAIGVTHQTTSHASTLPSCAPG